MANGRPPIGGAPRGQLDTDLTGLPADNEARWVREYTLGERDLANVQTAMADGFQPATSDMLPNANPPLLPGDEDTSRGLIRRGGQILMIRDKRIGEAERRHQRREVTDMKNAAARLDPGEGALLDDKNFIETKQEVVERTTSGEAARPAAPRAAGGRFKDV